MVSAAVQGSFFNPLQCYEVVGPVLGPFIEMNKLRHGMEPTLWIRTPRE